MKKPAEPPAGWKAALFSSGILLELEASRQLVARGFSVSSDIRFSRPEYAIPSESAIDVHAVAFPPFSRTEKISAKVELLVECCYENPASAWVFMPDVNKAKVPPMASGNAIRVIDYFSPYYIRPDAMDAFDQDFAFCRKGVQIDPESESITQAKLDAAVNRLQHAMPGILSENTLFYLTVDGSMNVPFFFCPVLLTNLPLYVLKKELDTKKIQNATDYSDISFQAPYVILNTDYTCEFETSCSLECRKMEVLHKSDKAMVIEQKKARFLESTQDLPFTIIDALVAGDRCYLERFFTKTIICSAACFPSLVDKIKHQVVHALKIKKEIY